MGLREGTAYNNQTVTNTSFYVNDSAEEVIFILSWKNGTLEFTLIDPSGETIDPADCDGVNLIYEENLSGESKSAKYTINDPQAGNWTLNIYGQSVAAGGETFGLSGTVEDTLSLNLSVDSVVRKGSNVDIKAIIDGYGTTSLAGTSVVTKITKPDDTIQNLTLSSTLNEGEYVGTLSNVQQTGSYIIEGNALNTGANICIMRENSISFSVLEDSFRGASGGTFAFEDVNGDSIDDYLKIKKVFNINNTKKIKIVAVLEDADNRIIDTATFEGNGTGGNTDAFFNFSLNEIWHSKIDGPLHIKNFMCYVYDPDNQEGSVPIFMKTYTESGSSFFWDFDNTDATTTSPSYYYANYAYEDTDNDGLSDRQEKNIFDTSHFDPDTDNDGLTDFDENAYGYVLGSTKNDVSINIYKENGCGGYDPLEAKDTTTDDKGFYNIADLEVGNYYVEANKYGSTFTPEKVYFSIPRTNYNSLDFKN